MVAFSGKILKKVEKYNIKDKKVNVKFIGDNTQANVALENLCSFEDGIQKKYQNSKKKTLIDSFEEAKNLFEKREGKSLSKPKKDENQNLNLKESPAKEYKEKTKKNKKDEEKSDSEKNKNNYSNSSYVNLNPLLIKSKRKRETEGDFIEPGSLLDKICNYLKYTAKNFSEIIEMNEKETLIRVFTYLSRYQIENPIELLKVTILF